MLVVNSGIVDMKFCMNIARQHFVVAVTFVCSAKATLSGIEFPRRSVVTHTYLYVVRGSSPVIVTETRTLGMYDTVDTPLDWT